jgi:hypothetical protein
MWRPRGDDRRTRVHSQPPASANRRLPQSKLIRFARTNRRSAIVRHEAGSLPCETSFRSAPAQN